MTHELSISKLVENGKAGIGDGAEDENIAELWNRCHTRCLSRWKTVCANLQGIAIDYIEMTMLRAIIKQPSTFSLCPGSIQIAFMGLVMFGDAEAFDVIYSYPGMLAPVLYYNAEEGWFGDDDINEACYTNMFSMKNTKTLICDMVLEARDIPECKTRMKKFGCSRVISEVIINIPIRCGIFKSVMEENNNQNINKKRKISIPAVSVKSIRFSPVTAKEVIKYKIKGKWRIVCLAYLLCKRMLELHRALKPGVGSLYMNAKSRFEIACSE